jgi:hypothetical protein
VRLIDSEGESAIYGWADGYSTGTYRNIYDDVPTLIGSGRVWNVYSCWIEGLERVETCN